jgi:hypothetical protein
MKSLISSRIAVLYIYMVSWNDCNVDHAGRILQLSKASECRSLELEALRLACTTDVGAVVYWLATGSWYGRMVSATFQRAAAVAALQPPSSSKS